MDPCIPHIGVFLEDLQSIRETSSRHLGFRNCIRIADRIKNLQAFKVHRYSDIIEPDRKMQKVLLLEFEKLRDISEDQIWEMSAEIKRKDANDAINE